MFTGIIETIARVTSIRRGGTTAKLSVDLGEMSEGTPIGDSIAINGACLTVTSFSDSTGVFDVSEETLRRTNLGELRPGDLVNVERSLQVGSRLAGHFVQGHVDGVGTLSAKDVRHEGGTVSIDAPPDIMQLIVEKGSIAVDGISLTVASLTDTNFAVAVIPHTLEVTTLGQKSVGARLNLETDILAKLVARLLTRNGGSPGGITEEMLREQGFA